MQSIENINYASDSGTEAIEKLDRNQRKIKDHLDSINVDEMQQQINILNGKVNVNKIYTSFTQINGSGAVLYHRTSGHQFWP